MESEFDLFAGLIPHNWLPDETLFSLCSRHHYLSRNFKASTTCLQLFGRTQKGLAHDLPSRIGHFCQITNRQLGSPEEIVEKRTLLPFYLPFTDTESARRAVQSMIGDSIGSLKFSLGLLTSGFRANHPLKVCRTCMSLDRQNVSTAYWHRQHQFPGVTICPLHGDLLQYSSLKATGVGRFQWTLPSEEHLAEPIAWPNLPGAAKLIARLAGEITTFHSVNNLEHSRLASAYRTRLYEMGMTRGNTHRLRSEAVGTSYADFIYPLLQHHEFQALPNNQDKAMAEVRRLTTGQTVVHHPIRHISLIAWLFKDYSDFKENYEKVDSHSYATVAETVPLEDAKSLHIHQLKDAFLLAVEQGTAISTAARHIGVDPATGMAWASSKGVAINHRPSKLKNGKRDDIVNSLRAGCSKATAASNAQVSESSVNRVLKTAPGLQSEWQEAVYCKAREENRSKWKMTIERNPNSGVKGNRIVESSAYAWLYRNDSKWLKEQNAKLPPIVKISKQRVDWDSRDKSLSSLVKSTSLLIAQEGPGKRVKLWQIYQKIPELKAKLAYLDKLPLTHEAIRFALTASNEINGSII